CVRHGRTDGAGDVVASLGPVDAAAAILSLRAARLRDLDAELREKAFPARCDFATAVDEHDVAPAHEHVAHGDAQAPGHVVVAHPGFAERGLDVMVRRPAI